MAPGKELRPVFFPVRQRLRLRKTTDYLRRLTQDKNQETLAAVVRVMLQELRGIGGFTVAYGELLRSGGAGVGFAVQSMLNLMQKAEELNCRIAAEDQARRAEEIESMSDEDPERAVEHSLLKMVPQRAAARLRVRGGRVEPPEPAR